MEHLALEFKCMFVLTEHKVHLGNVLYISIPVSHKKIASPLKMDQLMQFDDITTV